MTDNMCPIVREIRKGGTYERHLDKDLIKYFPVKLFPAVSGLASIIHPDARSSSGAVRNLFRRDDDGVAGSPVDRQLVAERDPFRLSGLPLVPRRRV